MASLARHAPLPRPGLNRFASGGSVYQRREVTVAFAAKKEMRDDPFFSSLFGVVGTVRPTLVPARGGTEVRQLLSVRWTLDERVNDGFYAARSLRIAQDILEDPERFLGAPGSAVVPTPEAWDALRARRDGGG